MFTAKSDLYGGGFRKNRCIGDCLKRGGLGQSADLRRGCLAKKKGVVFEGGGGVDAPMHTTNLFFQVHKIIVTWNNCIKFISLTSSSGGKFNLTVEKSFKKTFHWRSTAQKNHVDQIFQICSKIAFSKSVVGVHIIQ